MTDTRVRTLLTWLTLRRRALALGAGLLGFLAFMAASQLTLRATGTEVLLDAEPIDPRSLFRGFYVIIATPAHRLDAGLLAGADEFERGDEIFVVLTPGEDGVWSPISLARRAPDPQAGTVAMRGRVTSVRPAFNATGDGDAVGPFIRAAFNIESYFADQDGAKALETAVREERLRVIVSVARDGSAALKGLELDGVKTYDRVF